mmetsp:Transcript_11865/g.34638  ORF Transcript_11865/g.34638 Transcript_11865/m.34638 type:complete len:221 (+) Transcript_11865:78-740(+)
MGACASKHYPDQIPVSIPSAGDGAAKTLLVSRPPLGKKTLWVGPRSGKLASFLRDLEGEDDGSPEAGDRAATPVALFEEALAAPDRSTAAILEATVSLPSGGHARELAVSSLGEGHRATSPAEAVRRPSMATGSGGAGATRPGAAARGNVPLLELPPALSTLRSEVCISGGQAEDKFGASRSGSPSADEMSVVEVVPGLLAPRGRTGVFASCCGGGADAR